MNEITYLLNDDRWKDIPYPSGEDTIGTSGCGLLAALHCIMENPNNAKLTPLDVYPYMLPYVTENVGTAREGIVPFLEHFGMRDVIWFKEGHLDEAFQDLDRGNRIGIILLKRGKTPDGTVFTLLGHYMAFTDYRHENGEHLFFLKDSGRRGNDGWFSYEKSMGETLIHIWTCTYDGR